MHQERKTARTGRAFNTLSALSAFMLWGGWAYLVNGGHSFRKGIVSGLVQGTASSHDDSRTIGDASDIPAVAAVTVAVATLRVVHNEPAVGRP